MEVLVAIVAENATSERPGPYPNGTLCIVRNTRKLWYWSGSFWLPVALG